MSNLVELLRRSQEARQKPVSDGTVNYVGADRNDGIPVSWDQIYQDPNAPTSYGSYDPSSGGWTYEPAAPRTGSPGAIAAVQEIIHRNSVAGNDGMGYKTALELFQTDPNWRAQFFKQYPGSEQAVQSFLTTQGNQWRNKSSDTPSLVQLLTTIGGGTFAPGVAEAAGGGVQGAAIVGGATGAGTAALSGGSLSDVLKGGVLGAGTGAVGSVAGDYLSGLGTDINAGTAADQYMTGGQNGTNAATGSTGTFTSGDQNYVSTLDQNPYGVQTTTNPSNYGVDEFAGLDNQADINNRNALEAGDNPTIDTTQTTGTNTGTNTTGTDAAKKVAATGLGGLTLEKILSGDLTADDLAKSITVGDIGKLFTTGLGVYGANEKTNALRGIYDDMVKRRQPFLDKATGYLNDPNSYATGPGATTLDAVLRRLSVNGNPANNPTSLAIATQAGMQDWRNAVTGFGNLGLAGEDTRANVATNTANAAGDVYTEAGRGINAITRPKLTLSDIANGMYLP